jgi:signal transduction histidine kinase
VTDNARLALFFCQMFEMPSIFLPVVYLNFAAAMTEDIKKYKKVLVGAYIFAFAFLILDFTPYYIVRVEPIMGFKYWPMATIWTLIYIIFFELCAAFASYVLIKKYIESTGLLKLQIKYLAIALTLGFIAGTFEWFLWFKIPIPPYPHILLSVSMFLAAYLIFRYRLMDLKVVAKNILLYFGLAVFLYAIFYITTLFYDKFFGGVFTISAYLVGIIISPVVAIILYYSTGFLSDFINKYFFTSLYNYQQIIKQTAQELGRYTDLNNIADIIIGTIEKTLSPKSAALLFVDSKNDNTNNGKKCFVVIKTNGFNEKEISRIESGLFSRYFEKRQDILVKDELNELIERTINENDKKMLISLKDEMQKYDIVICVPLINNGLLSGTIVLGETLNKDSYTKEDFIFLETLSHQAQIAIDNSSLYRELEDKNKNLEELLSAKNDFIRIANHQLNTPLSIIRNAYSMVRNKTITPKEGMAYVGHGADRMSRVVKDFWNVLELEGEIKLNIQKIDIHPILENAVKDKKELLQTMKKKIKISIKKPAFNIPYVLCDEKQISNVVSNLLDNAIFYTQKGSVEISCEIIENNFLKVNVKDTGIGFSEDEKEKIGQKFYRTKNAISSYTDGSGLGVYICKKIVEANGGEFTFYSEGENKGAIFSFTLPLY